VVAAVREQDVGRLPAEIPKRVEERLPKVRVGRRAATVEEHEQLAPAAAAGRDDEDFVQVAMNEAAVHREAHDDRLPSALVASAPVA
jgi:hypothetical protein